MKAENPVFAYLFNTFDFPIRFIYCRLKPLRRLMFNRLYSSNIEAMDARFSFFEDIFFQNKITLENKTVLELGPGNSLMNTYHFYRKNVEKVILLDKFPLNAFAKTYAENKKMLPTELLLPKYFQEEKLFFTKKIYSESQFADIYSKTVERTQFVDEDLAETRKIQPNSVDIILSNSVLEHIYEPQHTINQSFKILKSGGFALHSIDYRDHYNFNRPFLFYKYSDAVWEKRLTKLGISYTNRLRHNEFKKFFTAAGFEILAEKFERLPMNELKVHPKFQNREDADISEAVFLLKKM